jgi:hypothetical protein
MTVVTFAYLFRGKLITFKDRPPAHFERLSIERQHEVRIGFFHSLMGNESYKAFNVLFQSYYQS